MTDRAYVRLKSESSNQLRSRMSMIAGNAERIVSRVAVDPGVDIRRRSRDIRRSAATAAVAAAAAATVAAATSGLQARPRVLVHRTRLMLAVYPMLSRVHFEPVRDSQGCDMRPAVGARARLVLSVVDDQEEALASRR